jgi:hypothetical protein
MEINLNTPKIIVIQQEKTKTIDKITVQRIVDLPEQKLVRVFIKEENNPITLWEGEQYDSVGQWTDDDVLNRLNEIYNQ